jgi:hypothetical protein
MLGRARIPVPAGWPAQQQVTLQLPSYPAADGSGFQANIVIARQLLAPQTGDIDAVAAERWRTLVEHLPQFGRTSSETIQLIGQRAERLTYGWHNGSHALRQVVILCALDGWLYDLTFTDVATRFDRSCAELDHWLAAIGLVDAWPGSEAHAAPARPMHAGTGVDLRALFGTPDRQR